MSSKGIDFNLTLAERYLIHQIADRAIKMVGGPRKLHKIHGLTKIDMVMDLTALHCNGNPLRLEEMLRADDFNFAHDVFQISNYLDRSTGKLTGLFVPRFSSATPRARVAACRARTVAG